MSAAKNQQIDAGIALYKERCVQCHSENLAGGAGPPLKGDDFLIHWKGKPLRSLYSRILTTMPQNDPGSLEPAEVLSLVAYIASQDSLASWETAFKSADELSAITMDQHK